MYIFRHVRIVFWLGIVDGKKRMYRSLQLGNEDVMLLFVVVVVFLYLKLEMFSTQH